MTETNLTTKVALPRVALAITKTLEALEDGIYNEEEFREIMGDLDPGLMASIDWRISFLDYLGDESSPGKAGSGIIGDSQNAYRLYRERMERAVRLRDQVKSWTLVDIEAKRSERFQGTLGRLASQNNSAARLIVDYPLGSKTLSNLIDMSAAEVLDIPCEYIKLVTIAQLDTDRLKTDLQTGKELSWARLEKGTHLRVRR